MAERRMSEAERTKAERDVVPEPEQELIDAASELSFPASDPPSYMGGAAVAGGPPPPNAPREPASDTLAAQKRTRGRTNRKMPKRAAGGK